MATQDAIAKPRFWHTEVAYRETTTIYIQRDYDVHTESVHAERHYCVHTEIILCTYREHTKCTFRGTSMHIQRDDYVHTESIQSVHLEELVCTYREMTMYIPRRLLCTYNSREMDYVHTGEIVGNAH
jgi:hypothetical protein